MCTALANAGAKLDLADRNGYTALHWAASSGYPRAVCALVRAGAPVEVRLRLPYLAGAAER